MKKLLLILALISTVAYAGIDYVIQNKDQDKDIIVKVNDGGTSTEVMRIDGSSSNVGINETTPANKLHVSETATNSYIARFESNQASNAGIMLRDSSAAADAKNKFIRNSGGGLQFGKDVDAENSKTIMGEFLNTGEFFMDGGLNVGTLIRNDGEIRLAGGNAGTTDLSARIIGECYEMNDEESLNLRSQGSGGITLMYRTGASGSQDYYAVLSHNGSSSQSYILKGTFVSVGSTNPDVDTHLNIWKATSGTFAIKNRVGVTATFCAVVFNQSTGL